MPHIETVPARLAQALHQHADRTAFVDQLTTLRYGQLADGIARLQPYLPKNGAIAVFGKPSTIFGVAVTACVVSGRPFVHLDPAMPPDVLTNIILELEIDVILLSERPASGQLPESCALVDAESILVDLGDRPTEPIQAAEVAPDDPIYIVATSGTTGKPKCIPVTQQSAFLSYEWRDAYTPYDPSHMVGVYIFAIWEMLRPLRDGATVCFPRFSELMNPKDLLSFWRRHDVTEMLFTPSALEKTLQALPADATRGGSLQRIILNGEVVSDELIAAVADKLPGVTLWNLYSICETHDVSMTDVSHRQDNAGAVSVGVPMPHLRAVVLDHHDQICPTGHPGLLHFEGPRMLGPGYVNRPEETALRFRDLTIDGRQTRLYDTGDQGYVDADGAVYVTGRVAHMLKLRGHSIQTKELMESLRHYIGFAQAVPWVQEVQGQGKALIFYYVSDAEHAAQNGRDWGLTKGEMRMPAALAKALREELPAYCIPSYLVQLDEMPLDAVSGKCDYKRLPKIKPVAAGQSSDTVSMPTIAESAKIIGCAVTDLDPALSFHEQGGDSLMAVNLLMALEAAYGTRVDFDFALNVPLGRLHDILSSTIDAPQTHEAYHRKGVLLTGATGFLGRHVLAAAVRHLPADEVVYCVVRERRKDPADRLKAVADAAGVHPDRLVLIPSSIDDAQFGLDRKSYQSLASCIKTVIHCAAMVNLAVDREHMAVWSQAGIANVLQLCRDAAADLRFTSSSAVFPDIGGPFPEAATSMFEGCSGYGAAKIAAEHQIAKSGVPATILRLPSLYDLSSPNAKDIYEVIMAACTRMNAVPDGFTFRMVDVQAVATCLAGMPVASGTQYLNFAPTAYVTTELMPDNVAVLPLDTWLREAPLSEAERALIAADTSVLRATSTFAHDAAADAWQQVTGTPFTAVTDPTALVRHRFSKSAECAA